MEGGAPVIPGRRSVQIPALREFRIPHIREFGNMVEVCAASAGSAGCFCQGPPCERLASPPSVRPHLPRAAGHADESRPSAQAGDPVRRLRRAAPEGPLLAIGYSGDHGDDGGLNEEGRGEGRGCVD